MEKILIAKVLKPQGLKGEIKCKLENDDFSVIENISEVFLEGKDVPSRIKNMAYRQGYLYLTIGTIDSREKADLIRGFNLYARADQITIPDDQFMIDDLIDCTVVSEDGKEIGKLVDVQNYGATDLFVVMQYGREYMFPFVDDIVKKINTTAKIIVVDKQKYDEAKICE